MKLLLSGSFIIVTEKKKSKMHVFYDLVLKKIIKTFCNSIFLCPGFPTIPTSTLQLLCPELLISFVGNDTGSPQETGSLLRVAFSIIVQVYHSSSNNLGNISLPGPWLIHL